VTYAEDTCGELPFRQVRDDMVGIVNASVQTMQHTTLKIHEWPEHVSD
jgi:hypothetical protein